MRGSNTRVPVALRVRLGGTKPPRLNTLKARISFQVLTSMNIIFLDSAKEVAFGPDVYR
jgi:hypothetical protein